ncbi:MAG: Fe-S cluster assembly protein SufD [Acidimicrobiia bacterium]|nr:Fe-S cluster assembly protein SufD [Acidimicrobiia bacterium]MDH5502690.1 Fe-S cluster assembly protein SufD [Acidimicrobiia bacterium]
MLDRSIAEHRITREPPVLAERRRQGLATYETAAMPTAADEHWKYVDLDFTMETQSLPAQMGAKMAPPTGVSRVSATVVDGFVEIDPEHPGSVEIARFDEVARRNPELFSAVVASRSDDIFLAGNAAFAGDGLFIHVPRSTAVETPIVIDIQSVSAGTISFPHIAISLGENSEASIVLIFRSSEEELVVAPVVETTLGDAARLSMTSVQTWGRQTKGLGYQRVRLGRDSAMKMGEVGLGGALGRLDLSVDLDGDGSSYLLNGLSFGDGDQVLDYRMVLNHRGRNTSSDVLLKGAVEDQAESIFTGLLRIEEHATNTSAFENNRNLVLSAGAKAQSVPNLEILCDDVVCGHGSTVGPLEEEHLYYLASRGIGRERAERVLVKGFFDEVIDKLPSQSVAAPVRDEVERKFVAAQAAGRLG